jgi:hypothetical protein
MHNLIKIPHAVHESTCYMNGLFDVLTWNGAKYDYYLLCMIGGMASFAYLRFKTSNPPCMVYWGNNSKYLLTQLEEIIGFKQTVSEGKSFNHEFPKMKQYLDTGTPVMVGALDMYFLHYYPEIYQQQHIPIHYVLVVGYDDEKKQVYVQDCSLSGVQEITYTDFQASLNVNVPGMSKKNTYRVFTVPATLPSELAIAENGFADVAGRMLKPPVNMLGIPAMRKLAREIIEWQNPDCFHHLVAYAGLTPPLIAADLSHNDGLRSEKARVLKEMGQKYQRQSWEKAAILFSQSGDLIVQLCHRAMAYEGKTCADIITRIADIEETAYTLL